MVERKLHIDRRKPILVNKYEQLAHSDLIGITAKFGMAVYPKVRVADVLDITDSGLSDNEYRYALKSHFDFVIVQSDSIPVMAIELDGQQHQADSETMTHDRFKNSICTKLGLPLIRIDTPFLKKITQQHSILGWLIDVWFHYEAWSELQARGAIAPDEPFLYFAAIGLDPFIHARARIMEYYRKGLILTSVPEVLGVSEPEGYVRSVALIRVTESQTCVGTARCRVSIEPRIPSVGSYGLSEELAVLDALARLDRHFTRPIRLPTNEEVDKVRDHYSRDGGQF